jgi:hypothetical protein
MPDSHILYEFIVMVWISMQKVWLHGVLIEGSWHVGESFPAISANEAMMFSAFARLLQFGTNPPVVILEFEGRTYFHITQDPAQPDVLRDTPTKVREQR